MTVEVVALHVETLRCEAPESEVLDGLLAHDGVVDAEVDFENEHVNVHFDAHVTSRDRLADALGFFGLTVRDARTRGVSS